MDIELYKKRKKELNLTYDELAKISGVSRRMITGLFNFDEKYSNPSLTTIQAIESALKIDNEKKSIMERPTSEIMELIEHDDYFKQFANLYKLMTEVQKGIFLSYVITTLKKAGINTVPYIGY